MPIEKKASESLPHVVEAFVCVDEKQLVAADGTSKPSRGTLAAPLAKRG
jgi:hypothetical protein